MPQFDQFGKGFDPTTVMPAHVEFEMAKPFPGNKHDQSLAESLSDLGGSGWHNRPWLDTDVKHADEPVVELVNGLPLELTQDTSYPPQAKSPSPSGARSPTKCERCGLTRHWSHEQPAPCICGHKCIDLAESSFCPDIEVPMSDYPSRDYQVLPESHQQTSPPVSRIHSSGQRSPILRRHSSLCAPPIVADEEPPELPTTDFTRFTAEPRDIARSNSIPMIDSLETQRQEREDRQAIRQQHLLEQARHEVLFGGATMNNVYAHDVTRHSNSITTAEHEESTPSSSMPITPSLESQHQDRERRLSIRQHHKVEQARHEVLFGSATIDHVYAHDATEQLRERESQTPKPAAELPVAVLPDTQQKGEKYIVAEEGDFAEDEEEDYEDESDEDEVPNCDGPEEDSFPRWMDRSRAC